MLRTILSQDSEERPILTPEEFHHLVRVRRLGPGEEFLGLSVVQEKWFRCRLREGAGPLVELLREENLTTESALSITLAQALVQRDRFEWILQKAVELGVDRVIPLRTRFTEFRLPSQKTGKLQQRWNRILVEAVKQCGRSRLPRITAIQSLDECLASTTADLRFYLDEVGGQSLREVIAQSSLPASCAFLIGPEGGWEKTERELIQAQGLAAAHLGSTILRAETAAVVTIGILQYEYGDYGRPPS